MKIHLQRYLVFAGWQHEKFHPSVSSEKFNQKITSGFAGKRISTNFATVFCQSFGLAEKFHTQIKTSGTGCCFSIYLNILTTLNK
jgi:hypothetical protein